MSGRKCLTPWWIGRPRHNSKRTGRRANRRRKRWRSTRNSRLNARIQAHATMPAIYVNVGQQDQLDKAVQIAEKSKEEALPWDRFRIVRLQASKDKRVVGDIKIAVYGKVSQEQKFVPATAAQLTGGWVKVTPSGDLAPGEYAVVELL